MEAIHAAKGCSECTFSTTAPNVIASQFSLIGCECSEHSSLAFAKQKTGQSSVSVKQMVTAMRRIPLFYQREVNIKGHSPR